MPESLKDSTTSTHRLAVVAHFVALLALLGSTLLPEAMDLYILVVLPVALWVPSGYLAKGKTGHTLRCMAVIGICLFVATSNRLDAIPRMSDEGALTVMALGLSWLACALCIPEGVVFSFPLGLLSSVTAAVRASGYSGCCGWLAGLGAGALLVSGSLLFIDGLKHPGLGKSVLSRTSMWRFSPHLFVGLLAAALMLSTLDLFRGHLGWLATRLPTGNGDSGICQLVARPPSFKGRLICRIRSRKGPLPTHLAERYFNDYQTGTWLRGTPCLTSPKYGVISARQPIKDLPECVVEKVDSGDVLPVPVGIVRDRMGALSGRDGLDRPTDNSVAKIFAWSPNTDGGSFPLPDERATQLKGLRRLKERARNLCSNTENDLTKTILITNYLRRHAGYDSAQPFVTETGVDPAEQFLFITRRGWCVHFATAAALMLRAVDIPTRLVTGYAVPTGTDVVAILDSHGHAWCEAYVTTERGQRWVIVDPSVTGLGIGGTALRLPRSVVGMALVAAAAAILLAAALRTSMRPLREEAEDDLGRPDPELVTAIYDRIVRAMARKGFLYRGAWTPREFAVYGVPVECRNDTMLIAKAFEKVRYMGFRRLEPGAVGNLLKAQTRLLSAKIRPGNTQRKGYNTD